MDFFARNYQGILAVIAIIGVAVNFFSLWLQRQRDSEDAMAKRIDEAAKIAKAATDLMSPLDHRVDDLEKDKERFEMLVKSQAEQIERMQKQYDTQHYELRAVKADRDNLLQRVLILQGEHDKNKSMIDQLRSDLAKNFDENSQLKVRIAQLEAELKLYKNGQSKGASDEEANANANER